MVLQLITLRLGTVSKGSLSTWWPAFWRRKRWSKKAMTICVCCFDILLPFRVYKLKHLEANDRTIILHWGWWCEPIGNAPRVRKRYPYKDTTCAILQYCALASSCQSRKPDIIEKNPNRYLDFLRTSACVWLPTCYLWAMLPWFWVNRQRESWTDLLFSFVSPNRDLGCQRASSPIGPIHCSSSSWLACGITPSAVLSAAAVLNPEISVRYLIVVVLKTWWYRQKLSQIRTLQWRWKLRTR